jgi:hypothetical protein
LSAGFLRRLDIRTRELPDTQGWMKGRAFVDEDVERQDVHDDRPQDQQPDVFVRGMATSRPPMTSRTFTNVM